MKDRKTSKAPHGEEMRQAAREIVSDVRKRIAEVGIDQAYAEAFPSARRS